MINISIIGTGNVAYHISNACLKHKEINLNQLCGRKNKLPVEFNQSINYTSDLGSLKTYDLCLICVSDDQIEHVSNKIQAESHSIILHCSGSTSINVLNHHSNFGVLYPVQTFSLGKKIEFNKIPIAIESNSNENLKKIKEFASLLSEKVIEASSEQRQSIHVAAVFTSNFTNYMRIIADEILEKNNIDSKVLDPLTEETAEKLKFLNPKDAQTGPALRNDTKTIEKHLNLLKDSSHQKLYKMISSEITKLKK